MVDFEDIAYEDSVSSDTYDDGMPEGIVTGCDPEEYEFDASDPYDIEYDR